MTDTATDLAALRESLPTEDRILADHEIKEQDSGLLVAERAGAEAYGRRYVSITGFAAADWEYVLPNGYDWKFSVGTAILHTSSTAGNRFLGFHIYDNASGTPGIAGKTNNQVYGVPNAQTITINQNGNAHYYRGETLVATGTSAMVPCPDMLLPAGWSIGSESFPLAGDTWSQIVFLLEAFLPRGNL